MVRPESSFSYFAPCGAGMKACNVNHEFVKTVNKLRGIHVAIIDPHRDCGGVILSGANLNTDQSPLPEDAVWANAGLLLLQNDLPESENLAAAKIARSLAIPVLMNAVSVRPLGANLANLVDVLVVNAEGAAQMGANVVTDLQTATTAAETLAARFAAVVVTVDGAGLAAWSAMDEAFCVPAEVVAGDDPESARDVFIRCLADALAQGAALQIACETALKAADHQTSTGLA